MYSVNAHDQRICAATHTDLQKKTSSIFNRNVQVEASGYGQLATTKKIPSY